MKLISAVILAAATTALAKRGTPIHVLVVGNAKDPTATQYWRDKITQQIADWCHNVLGGNELNGGFDEHGVKFSFSCDCGHGNTVLPHDFDNDMFKATATNNELIYTLVLAAATTVLSQAAPINIQIEGMTVEADTPPQSVMDFITADVLAWCKQHGELIHTIVLAVVAPAIAFEDHPWDPPFIRLLIKGHVTNNTPEVRTKAAAGALHFCLGVQGQGLEDSGLGNEMQPNGDFTYICDCATAILALPWPIDLDEGWVAEASYLDGCK
ncbi:hypothetical protein E4U55_005331 [Claviceps digitariae]|nr:hypothetical protein E4U55_005331 [Claviceps digitariae]